MAFAYCCSIPLRQLQLSQSLSCQREKLRLKLAEQVETLPLENECWLQTERELVAAEKALDQLTALS